MESHDLRLVPAVVVVFTVVLLAVLGAMSDSVYWPWQDLRIRAGDGAVVGCVHTVTGVFDGYSTLGFVALVVAVVFSLFGKASRAKTTATVAGALMLLSASLLSNTWLERAILGSLPDPVVRSAQDCVAIPNSTLAVMVDVDGYARAMALFATVTAFVIALEVCSPAFATGLAGRAWARRRKFLRWSTWSFLVAFGLFWVLAVWGMTDNVTADGGDVVGGDSIPTALTVVLVTAAIPRTRVRAFGIVAASALAGTLFALFGATYQLYYSHLRAKPTGTRNSMAFDADLSQAKLDVPHEVSSVYGVAIIVCGYALLVAFLSKGLLRPKVRPAPATHPAREPGPDTQASAPVDTQASAPVDAQASAPVDAQVDAPVDASVGAQVGAPVDAAAGSGAAPGPRPPGA